MSPIFFTVDHNMPLMIVPNVEVHLNGHTVLTYTYDVFLNKNEQNALQGNTLNDVIKDKANNAGYLGFITFERKDNNYKYSGDGAVQLSRAIIEEIIEKIKLYRQNPGSWPL